MNSKKWIILTAFYFLTNICPGQIIFNTSDFKVNLMGGPSISQYSGSDISGNIPIIRYYAGGRVGYFFTSLLEVETGYGFNMVGTYEKNEHLKVTHTATYHQIPLVLKLKIRKIAVGTGLEINFLQNAVITSKNSTLITDAGGPYRGGYWSWISDLSYDVDERSAFGISFSYGLQTVIKRDYDWKAGAFRILYIIHLY
jgi:hypothetical protein